MRRLGIPRSAAGPAAARIATLPVSVVCGFLTIRIIIESFGVTDFAVISLLVALQIVLPFLDLGTGAGVLDGGARYRATHDLADLATPLRTALRITASTCIAAFLVVTAVALVDGWPGLLGRAGDHRLNSAVVVIFAINVLGRPLVLVLTALIGLGRAALVVVLQLLAPLTGLGVVAVASVADGGIVVCSAYVVAGQLACGAVAVLVLRGMVPGLARALLSAASKDGVDRTRRMAGPMLAITILGPLGVGFDRLVLSHLSDTSALAMYAVAAQIGASGSSLVTAIQQGLWADFARERSAGSSGLPHRVWSAARALLVAGALGGLLLALVMPWVARWASGGEIRLSTGLVLAVSATFALQLALAAPGAALTTPRGLNLQARVLSLAVVVNLTITIATAGPLGASGPALGSLVAAALQLTLSTALYGREVRSGPGKQSSAA